MFDHSCALAQPPIPDNFECAGVLLVAFTLFGGEGRSPRIGLRLPFRRKAVAAVEKELGPGWIVTLTDRRLSNQRLSILKMLPNTVRKL